MLQKTLLALFKILSVQNYEQEMYVRVKHEVYCKLIPFSVVVSDLQDT